MGDFALRAFARGDRLFYLGDRSDERAVIDMLDAAGADGERRLAAGELSFLHSSQMVMDGGFDPERLQATWGDIVAAGRADGYNGVAATAEMTWALTWNLPADALIDYESSLADTFASGELAALCQYDSRWMPEDVLPRATDCHELSAALDEDGWSADWSRVLLDYTQGSTELGLGGDIDLANVSALRPQLTELLSDGDAVADCSEIRFADVAGCRLLRDACLGNVAPGKLTIANAPPVLQRVMKLCNWADGVL